MGPEWLLLDNGTIDTKEAIDRIDNKSILKRAEIVSVFNNRTGIMFHLDDNLKLLPALRKEGFKACFLSCFHFDVTLFDALRAMIIVKPLRGIRIWYQHFYTT
jgi:hypothetical protein